MHSNSTVHMLNDLPVSLVYARSALCLCSCAPGEQQECLAANNGQSDKEVQPNDCIRHSPPHRNNGCSPKQQVLSALTSSREK